jgi:putative ABC transport system permease protein
VLRFGYQGGHIPVDSRLTITGLPGAPRLEVVGLAVSISGSADAWVVPAGIARLRLPGTPGTVQMLYRLDGAATAAAIGADVAGVSAALPVGAVTGARSYLTVKATDTASVRRTCPS